VSEHRAPRYRIEAEGSGETTIHTVRLEGAASFGEINALLRELDALSPALVLLDESGLRPGMVSPGHIKEIAEQWRKAGALRSARIAVFTPNLVIYGLNRMFQGLADAADRVRVFTSEADARSWLLNPPAP
jgi:hypothetical protein